MGGAFSRPNPTPSSADQTNTPAIPDASNAESLTGTIRPEAASLPMKRKRREKRGDRKRRDNRKSRFDKDYVEVDERQNSKFDEYYRVQKIVPPEEHEMLLKTMASPLPSSFRVVADGSYGAQILKQLRGPMSDIFHGVAGAQAPEPLPWVPNERAWVVNAPRQMLRRDNVLAPFHKFLVAATELGGVARQEAVSMIPPLLLAPKPGDAVLDMCAAPGSKTGQILEAISGEDGLDKLPRDGIVIANDTDLSRCWMLAHQLKRFAASQLVITNQDAQEFPKVRAFDRVLCDVPCSGDGTLRKAPDIWRRWHAGMGMGLHRIQCSILVRGIELVKPGGRLVYSTCSLNPIENEAVVAFALKKFGPDVIELLDVSASLPELKRRPGLTSWVVPNLSGESNKPVKKGDNEMVKDDDRICIDGTKRSDGMNGDSSPKRKGENGGIVKSNEEEGTVDEMIVEHSKSTQTSAGIQCSMEEKNMTNLEEIDTQEQSTQRVHVEKSPLPGWYTNCNQVEHRRRRKVLPSMFPPSDEFLKSGHCPLERCMRLVPYDQNTGGFFVAVLKKKPTAPIDKKMKQMLQSVNGTAKVSESVGNQNDRELASQNTERISSIMEDIDLEAKERVESGDQSTTSKEEQKNEIEKAKSDKSKVSSARASRLITDDPLIGVENLDLTALQQLSQFFGLNLTDCRRCLMTRGADAEKFKKIVLVSPAVRDLLRLSVGGSESSSLPSFVRRDRLRVVFAGVTMFDRTTRRDTTIPFRIVSDGAATLARCMRKRVICIGEKDFGRLVHDQLIQLATLESREARIVMDEMESGSAIVRDSESGDVAVIWKSQHNLSLLIGKMERNALIQRVEVGQIRGVRSAEVPQRAETKDDAVVPC